MLENTFFQRFFRKNNEASQSVGLKEIKKSGSEVLQPSEVPISSKENEYEAVFTASLKIAIQKEWAKLMKGITDVADVVPEVTLDTGSKLVTIKLHFFFEPDKKTAQAIYQKVITSLRDNKAFLFASVNTLIDEQPHEIRIEVELPIKQVLEETKAKLKRLKNKRVNLSVFASMVFAGLMTLGNEVKYVADNTAVFHFLFEGQNRQEIPLVNEYEISDVVMQEMYTVYIGSSPEYSLLDWRDAIRDIANIAEISFNQDNKGYLSFEQYFAEVFLPTLYQQSRQANVPFDYLLRALRISGQNTYNTQKYNEDVYLSNRQLALAAITGYTDSRLGLDLAEQFGLVATASAEVPDLAPTSSPLSYLNIALVGRNDENQQALLARDLSSNLPMSYYDVVRLLNPTYGLADLESSVYAGGIEYYLSHVSPDIAEEFRSDHPEVIAIAQEVLALQAELDSAKEMYRDLVYGYIAQYADSFSVFFDLKELGGVIHTNPAWEAIGLGKENRAYELLLRYTRMWRLAGWNYTVQDRDRLFSLLTPQLLAEFQAIFNGEVSFVGQTGLNGAALALFADMGFDNPQFITYLQSRIENYDAEKNTPGTQAYALEQIVSSLREMTSRGNRLGARQLEMATVMTRGDLDTNLDFQMRMMVGVHGWYMQNAIDANVFNLNSMPSDRNELSLAALAALIQREIVTTNLLSNERSFPLITGVDAPYNHQDQLADLREWALLIRDQEVFDDYQYVDVLETFRGETTTGIPEENIAAATQLLDSSIGDWNHYSASIRARSVLGWNELIYDLNDSLTLPGLVLGDSISFSSINENAVVIEFETTSGLRTMTVPRNLVNQLTWYDTDFQTHSLVLSESKTSLVDDEVIAWNQLLESQHVDVTATASPIEAFELQNQIEVLAGELPTELAEMGLNFTAFVYVAERLALFEMREQLQAQADALQIDISNTSEFFDLSNLQRTQLIVLQAAGLIPMEDSRFAFGNQQLWDQRLYELGLEEYILTSPVHFVTQDFNPSSLGITRTEDALRFVAMRLTSGEKSEILNEIVTYLQTLSRFIFDLKGLGIDAKLEENSPRFSHIMILEGVTLKELWELIRSGDLSVESLSQYNPDLPEVLEIVGVRLLYDLPSINDIRNAQFVNINTLFRVAENPQGSEYISEVLSRGAIKLKSEEFGTVNLEFNVFPYHNVSLHIDQLNRPLAHFLSWNAETNSVVIQLPNGESINTSNVLERILFSTDLFGLPAQSSNKSVYFVLDFRAISSEIELKEELAKIEETLAIYEEFSRQNYAHLIQFGSQNEATIGHLHESNLRSLVNWYGRDLAFILTETGELNLVNGQDKIVLTNLNLLDELRLSNSNYNQPAIRIDLSQPITEAVLAEMNAILQQAINAVERQVTE